MAKSTVVDSKTGNSKDSRNNQIMLQVGFRTSSGMFLWRGRDKVIRDIEKRIADYTFIPEVALISKGISGPLRSGCMLMNTKSRNKGASNKKFKQRSM